MASPIDIAWSLLKNVDFRDIGPMPTRYRSHPDNVPYEGHEPPPREQMRFEREYQQDPKMEQERMEESYVPDVQQMLELEALRQASGGQQVPLNLLRDPNIDEWYGQPYHEILNLPQGGTENLPLPPPTQ